METKWKQFNESKKDMNLGQDIVDLFAEYGLAIQEVNEGSYVHKKFPDREPFNETSNKEYRVTLCRIKTVEWFENNWGENSLEDALGDEDRPEYIEEITQDWNDIGKGTYDSSERLEFSIFMLQDEWRKLHDKGKKLFDQFVWLKAAAYMKMLSLSVPSVYTNPPLDGRRGLLSDKPEEFIKFLDNYNIQIINKTLQDVSGYEYRLYQDSKFFSELELELDTGTYNELIKDFLNLI